MPRRPNRRVRPVPPSALTPVGPPGRQSVRRPSAIVPCEWRHQTEVPDAVPAIVSAYAIDRDQLLLAKVRHNRLLDLALGMVSYSLGSVRQALVPRTAPVDVDELYVGLRDFDPPCIVPVMIQRSDDPINAPRLGQVESFCRHLYPSLTPRFMAVQFVPDEDHEAVVLFDLIRRGNEVKLQDEKQYRLVPADQITRDDPRRMAQSSV